VIKTIKKTWALEFIFNVKCLFNSKNLSNTSNKDIKELVMKYSHFLEERFYPSSSFPGAKGPNNSIKVGGHERSKSQT
jgi:hypothetical protein